MPLRSGRFGFTLDVDVEHAASEITPRRWPAVALRFAYIVGLIALAWFGGHASMNLTANHPATTATVLVGVGLVLAAVTVYAPPRHYVSGGWKPRWLVPFLVAAGISPGYGWIMGHEQRQPGRMLYDYCAYGSVSQPQLDGCMEHVTLSHTMSSRRRRRASLAVPPMSAASDRGRIAKARSRPATCSIRCPRRGSSASGSRIGFGSISQTPHPLAARLGLRPGLRSHPHTHYEFHPGLRLGLCGVTGLNRGNTKSARSQPTVPRTWESRTSRRG
jgi:hypothetical protein